MFIAALFTITKNQTERPLTKEWIGKMDSKKNIYTHTHNGILFIHKEEWTNIICSNMDGPAAAAAKSLQSCPTLWDPRDGGPPGSPVPGILQARTPEWVATSSSNAGK